MPATRFIDQGLVLQRFLKLILTSFVLGPLFVSNLQAQIPATWNPGAVSYGLWNNAADWGGTVPGPGYKAFFSVNPAVPCVVTNTEGGCQVSIGDGGPGVLIVTNGGNLTCGDSSENDLDDHGWTGIGTGSGAGTLIISAGANVTFAYHVWIGLSPGGVGTLIMNGGTATITNAGGAFGIGTSGGTGSVTLNGGSLNINNNLQLPLTNTAQINIAGGSLVLNGNATGTVDPLISTNKIVAYGGAGTIYVNYNGTTTTLTGLLPVTNTPSVAAISIAMSPTNLTLFWPTSSVYYALQSATSLAYPIAWQDVTNNPVVSGTNNQVVLPLPGGPTYYSLDEGVDVSTMSNKLLMGYQGWFQAAGDGSPSAGNPWFHWFNTSLDVATNASVDLLPDTSELGSDELFPTSMTYSNGQPVYLYSPYVAKTMIRHFKWMRDYGLDGVFLQRFATDIQSSQLFQVRNQETQNARAGAEQYGRVFAIMYDVSGLQTNVLMSTLTNDWIYLVKTLQVTNSPRYLHHRGKPVVALWGFGFNDGNHPAVPQQAQNAINWFRSQGLTVMGGVPTHWRTLNGDSYTNTTWTPVYLSFDVVSPWAVGRYSDNSGADNYASTVTAPDLVECTANGVDYMPVVFPGFSWHNLMGGGPSDPVNQIPRNGGNFYWRQVYDSINVGCTMIYGAMFDEMNEGTAMFKMEPTPAQLPAQGTFVPLDIDGYNLPSDWYLQLAGQAGMMLRGQIPLQSNLPISPP